MCDRGRPMHLKLCVSATEEIRLLWSSSTCASAGPLGGVGSLLGDSCPEGNGKAGSSREQQAVAGQGGSMAGTLVLPSVIKCDQKERSSTQV